MCTSTDDDGGTKVVVLSPDATVKLGALPTVTGGELVAADVATAAVDDPDDSASVAHAPRHTSAAHAKSFHIDSDDLRPPLVPNATNPIVSKVVLVPIRVDTAIVVEKRVFRLSPRNSRSAVSTIASIAWVWWRGECPVLEAMGSGG